MKKELAAWAISIAMLGAFCACSSDNDEQPTPPAPPTELEPNEIPGIESAPTKFTGFENINHDTIPFSWMGMHDLYAPVINICEEREEGKAYYTEKYDSEIYFEHDGKEYRLGDKLPDTQYDVPIGHTVKTMASGPESIQGITLGTFDFHKDDVYVLHWPAKNLKVYLKIYTELKYIRLSDGSPWEGDNYYDPDGAFVFHYGLYVNGEGHQQLWLKVGTDGKVKLYHHPNEWLGK
jgi:lipoprotein